MNTSTIQSSEVGGRHSERLLTAIEAASILGVGRSKLYELMARGAITSVKLDRCRRFRQSDLDRFIDDLGRDAAS